jgi:hypothetical protein
MNGQWQTNFENISFIKDVKHKRIATKKLVRDKKYYFSKSILLNEDENGTNSDKRFTTYTNNPQLVDFLYFHNKKVKLSHSFVINKYNYFISRNHISNKINKKSRNKKNRREKNANIKQNLKNNHYFHEYDFKNNTILDEFEDSHNDTLSYEYEDFFINEYEEDFKKYIHL